jgi:hypothetical protein
VLYAAKAWKIATELRSLPNLDAPAAADPHRQAPKVAESAIG